MDRQRYQERGTVSSTTIPFTLLYCTRPVPSPVMSPTRENYFFNDFLNDSTRSIFILSQLHLRSRELRLLTTEFDSGAVSSSSPTASMFLQARLSLELPQPLTSNLLNLGLPPLKAQYISGTYIKAAIRLKSKLEAHFQHRADRGLLELKISGGFSPPRSQTHIRTVYASHFRKTTASWAEVGMLSTQRWLLKASLKNRLRSCSLAQPAHKEEYVTTLPHTDRRTTGTTLFDISDKTEPLIPRISIGKKTKHSAGLTTRDSTISSCDGTLDQTIPEPARLAPVIKPDSEAGLTSNRGAATKGPKPQRSAGQNPSSTSWDSTSLIDDFDGLSIRDRSKSIGLKVEDGTCKAAPSGHIFTLSKHSSSSSIRLPTPAGVQLKASSSRPRSSLQSSYDIHSHSASSQSARRRKFAPCPNRDRSTQSTYKGPDVLFSRQTNDMTFTSSAANAKELSDPTSHYLSPSASTHTRRRKIAPLPPRHPSTTTTDIAVIISPDLRRSSQRPPHKPLGSRQYTTGTTGRLTGPLSRSPSLTSLSSDESGLSCSDELETPPSSPTLPSTILPTTSSAISLLPGEYRFLSATCLRNMSPAPQLLKAENPRPRTFTFSARDEDSHRFPFSR
uniref:A2 mating type protein n=1 Tax=Heterobasidion annosum TaxID=13563 RepID=S5RA61_HETAN|nr:a2 mating type protein [Heterobasidion annosum]